jgi:hypothetical protein
MEPVVIIVLVVVIGLLAGVLAWFGPRMRHWRVHRADPEDAEPDRNDGSSG